MRKIILCVLLIILATSHYIQKEKIIEKFLALRDQPSVQVEVTEETRTKKKVESLAYPAPDDPYPYAPPPNYTQTPPPPTATFPPLPTPAPTMNPYDD